MLINAARHVASAWTATLTVSATLLKTCRRTQPVPAPAMFCAQVVNPEGRFEFHGPRVAMAIHEDTNYDLLQLQPDHPVPEAPVDYGGVAVGRNTPRTPVRVLSLHR